MIRIGFTGTQEGLTDEQELALNQLLESYEQYAVEFHHGDCVGADARAHELADNFSFDIVIHPPDKDDKRAFCTGGESWPEKPYLTRNRDIVDCSTVLIACPNGEEKTRSGTWATIRYTRTKIYEGETYVIYIIMPHGTVIFEGRPGARN